MGEKRPGVNAKRPAVRLLDEFETPSDSAWREAAEKTLRGASIEQALHTKTYEGIDLKPIYGVDDLEDLAHRAGTPGALRAPLSTLGGIERDTGTPHPWLVCQEITAQTPAGVNMVLKSDLARGQRAIRLDVPVATAKGFEEALKGISLNEYPLYLGAGASGLATLSVLVAAAKNKGTKIEGMRGAVEMAPLEVLGRDGILPTSLEKAYDEMAVCTSFAAEHLPLFSTIGVSTHAAHDAGASAVEELAFAVASGVEYIRKMGDRGLDLDTVLGRMGFSFSVRGDFFMEVAKLRAARLLWRHIVSEFGGAEGSFLMNQYVRTSKWSKTATDPYVNMVRGTTETLSAAFGGADVIQTAPFDEPIRYPDEFSRRIARNVQSILREECHVGAVLDPTGGSYYVETLTDRLAKKAWTVFQELESQGGMGTALKKGLPQKMVEKVAATRARDFATRDSVMVGTNMYADIREEPLEGGAGVSTGRSERDRAMRNLITDEKRRERVHPHLARLKDAAENQSFPVDGDTPGVVSLAVEAAEAGAFVGEIRGAFYGSAKWGSIESEPFDVHRPSARYETMREAVRGFARGDGGAPKVFLANMGPVAKHKPRADFSRGFFEVGGFDVLGNPGFDTPEAAARAACDSGATISVICSTDETYPGVVAPFIKAVKEGEPDMKVILAGYPKDQIQSHRQSGVDGFIHLKSDNFGMLTELLNHVGVSI